jgi:methanogenic corrinoid protein MtbC1
MTEKREAAAELIDDIRAEAAARITARTFARRPELAVRYGRQGQERCLEDANFHLRYLAEAVRHGRASIFNDYVAWAKVMLAERRIPSSDLRTHLEETVAVLSEVLDGTTATTAAEYIRGALGQLETSPLHAKSFIDPDAPYGALAAAFLKALLSADRNTASRLVADAVESGASVRDIYIHVFQQSQREVGRLWQTNQITVAHEHFCTAATQVIMTQLYSTIFRTERVGRLFVASCVGGELHEMGMRMVADFFEMEGWDAQYLGANMPRPHLLSYLQRAKPDVLGLSATITYHVSEISEIIRDIRNDGATRRIKVMVGGYPFNREPELWKEVGADGYATDAASSVKTAHELIA